tara:strand:- start:636 stop:1109 length:474 start_codon:yes stop_codon:yes gene_type:complete
MTTSFADYAAQQDARNTIQLNVVKYAHMLCDALRQNFIDYSIKSHEYAIKNNGIVDESYVPYHQECVEKLKNGECNYDFIIESGRKYHKVIMVIDNGAGRSPSRSVHAFVDKKTGEIYKAASFRAPAKHVRYDLRIIEQREWVLSNADWAGGWLYLR